MDGESYHDSLFLEIEIIFFWRIVYEAALRLRLAEVCRRLRETDETVAAITAACGWPDPAPPKRLFKKRFGVSMRAWRNSSAKAGA